MLFVKIVGFYFIVDFESGLLEDIDLYFDGESWLYFVDWMYVREIVEFVVMCIGLLFVKFILFVVCVGLESLVIVILMLIVGSLVFVFLIVFVEICMWCLWEMRWYFLYEVGYFGLLVFYIVLLFELVNVIIYWNEKIWGIYVVFFIVGWLIEGIDLDLERVELIVVGMYCFIVIYEFVYIYCCDDVYMWNVFVVY